MLFLHSATFSQTKKPKLTREEKKQLAEKKKAEKKEEKRIRKEKRKHPENIEEYKKNFLFRPRYVYPGITMSVFNNTKKDDKFNWKTATPGLVGGAIKIKKVYVSVALKIPSNDALIKKYGDTKFRDINVNLQGRIVNWLIFYHDYKGFYLSDYKDFYPNWKQDTNAYPRAPNMHIIEAGLHVGFNFNRNFSLNAAFAQSERQKKSAGSFLMGIQERYQRIESDTNIVPYAQATSFPHLNRFVSGDFVSTILNVGLGYQFVMKKFHFTPIALVGSGIQFQSYTQSIGSSFWINAPFYACGKAQIGYNGDFFFTNIVYTLEFTSLPIKEARIRLYHNLIEFGIGVRF